MQYPVPAYVDIIRDFSAPLTVGDGTGKGRNREIGDVHHSNAVRLPLPFDHKMSPVLSGGKMQKMSSMLALVVSEGRLCALKPSEWSILLTGVVLCGFATMLFLASPL